MSERAEWEPVPVDEAIDRLAEAGLLTRRQAEAYVLRDIEAVPRQGAAESMDVSINVVDKYLRAARDKVQEAEETIDVVEELRYRDIPEECAECETALGGRWVGGRTDPPLCLDCAGVDPDVSP